MESRAARLESDGADGRYRLSGVLDFETVPGLLNESASLFAVAGADIEIDLSTVTESNSAGLGLLLEWLRRARLAGKRIRFRNMPAGMTAVAKASDLDGVIPVTD
jgi:phospholipid transport system transporter-binding protein